MEKTYEHRKISLAGYVPPVMLLDKVQTLSLDQLTFTIRDFGNVGDLTGKEKSLWQRTSSFAAKYFSDDNLAAHPLSMTFHKESVPEVFADPAAASSSSGTERQSAKPTDSWKI